MFHNSKVVYSLYNDGFKEKFHANYGKKMIMDGLTESDVKDLNEPGYAGITAAAMKWSDAVIVGTDQLDAQVDKDLKKLTKPVLPYHSPETYIDAIDQFYEEVLLEDSVLAD
jgi:starch synthase